MVLLSAVGAGDAAESAWEPRRRASRTCAGCVGDGREGSGEWIIWGGGSGGGEESTEPSSDVLAIVVVVVGAVGAVGGKVVCPGGEEEFLVK